MSLTLPCSSRAWYSFSRRWFPMWKDLALAEDSMMMARLAKKVFIFLSGVVFAPAFWRRMSQPRGLPASFCVFFVTRKKAFSLLSLSLKGIPVAVKGGWFFLESFLSLPPFQALFPFILFFMATRNSKSFCLMGRGKILTIEK